MDAPIGRDTLILTVNQRLARHLFFNHSEKQKNSGKKVWETPKIYELNTWLRLKWLQSNPKHFLLTKLQSIKAWELIIKNSRVNNQNENITRNTNKWDLLNRYSAAKQASQAYQTIKEYRLSISSDPLLLNTENNVFLIWLKKYRSFLHKNKAIDPADLIDVVQQKMKDKLISVPNSLELNGFDEITPQLLTLLDFFKIKQTKVVLNPDPEKKLAWPKKINTSVKNISIHSFNDLKEESRSCANWARSIYKKNQSIGIIVPELDKYRQTLHKEIFTNLIPKSIFPWTKEEPPFDISLGIPLSNEGMIQIVLDILSIPIHIVPFGKLLHIINNSYIKCGRINLHDRVEFEIKLKKEHLSSVDLELLESVYDIKLWPALEELIGHLINLSHLKDARLPSTWASIFSELLIKLGWLSNSEKTYSSREIQCLMTWNECLDELASLDSFIGKLSRQDTVKELKQITSRKLFQVKTKEQPIQILGLRDSMGITFDNLWVMGCHSDCIPAQPNPNPFIPIYLQREKQLPHCDPEYELKFAEQALNRLVESSNNIIFSYPEWERGVNKQVSSLLNNLSISNTEFSHTNSFRIRDHIKPLDKIELWQDVSCIPPSPQEIKNFTYNGLQAGYKVIMNQANCPFQAFAAHRLQANIYDQSTIDYGARERGILIHKALQLFWKKHKTRNKLQNLISSNCLKSEIKHLTNKAMKENGSLLEKQPYFINMEKERTVRLLIEWMEQEILRSDFTVKYIEKNETIIINNLKLHLRIDRIDITPENKTILIDYKTGSINSNAWFINRINEPQLPLYSTKLSPNGIAFAHISRGSLGWISAYDQKIPNPFFAKSNMKIPANIPGKTGWPDWDSLLNFWSNQLNELAGEFMDGILNIDPIKKSATCRNCGYKMLCRIGDSGYDDHRREN